MLFTYNSHSMAQRPLRSYSYKNQSIMAVAHRLLRDLPADGESVLSKRAKAAYGGNRPAKGLPPIDPSSDLIGFLKPHPRPVATTAPGPMVGAAAVADGAERPVKWDDDLQSADAELRTAWRVNVVNLDFREVTAVIAGGMLLISIFIVLVLPARDNRTPESDALEFGLVILATVMFSPLSFNYAYVWLLYPTTLAIHRVIGLPAGAPWRRLKLTSLAGILLIPALAIPMPQVAQAYGNLFVPSLLLVIGLGLMLRHVSARSEPAGVRGPHSRQMRSFERMQQNAEAIDS
jgi:hypothetical protein